jgi:hypothetical protein
LPSVALAAEKAPEHAKPRTNLPGVDWSSKTIKATGRGAPDLRAPSPAVARIGAEKAAEMDALRNILSVLRGIQLTSDETVGDTMRASDEVRTRLEGEAKGYRRVDTRYFDDGGVEIDVEMGIEGLLAELLPAPGAAKAGEPVSLPAAGETRYTGLVVDARGLHPKPALAPRLLDGAGRDIYNGSVVAQDAIKANGIAGYLKNLEEATHSARVGGKPLVVKAVKVAGASDLVLGDADAAKLRDPKGNVSYLAEGRVIIVAD